MAYWIVKRDLTQFMCYLIFAKSTSQNCDFYNFPCSGQIVNPALVKRMYFHFLLLSYWYFWVTHCALVACAKMFKCDSRQSNNKKTESKTTLYCSQSLTSDNKWPLFSKMYWGRSDFDAMCLRLIYGALNNWSPHITCDVIMSAIASQITSVSIVYSTVCSDADQRKHQSFASLAFVWGIHRWLVDSPQ